MTKATRIYDTDQGRFLQVHYFALEIAMYLKGYKETGFFCEKVKKFTNAPFQFPLANILHGDLNFTEDIFFKCEDLQFTNSISVKNNGATGGGWGQTEFLPPPPA